MRIGVTRKYIMDTQLFLLINGHHTPFLDHFMYLITLKTVWIPLYVSLLYIVWRNYSWKGILTVLLMVCIGMFITDWANAHLLRPWIGRLRPSNPDNPISSMVHIVNGRRGSGYGFPSAHSANIWLLALLMIKYFRNGRVTGAVTGIALLVCYSRIYLGFHYPGDILGGFVLAYIVSSLLMWANEKYLHFSTVRETRHAWVVATIAWSTVGIFAALALCNTF